jgi:hypothetical protein
VVRAYLAVSGVWRQGAGGEGDDGHCGVGWDKTRHDRVVAGCSCRDCGGTERVSAEGTGVDGAAWQVKHLSRK